MTGTAKRRALFVGASLLAALAGLVRYGNAVLILLESDAPSRSVGGRDDGRLENGKRLPSRGANFTTYSDLGSLLGRNSVHDRVRSTILDGYAALEETLPGTTFVIGETGWPRGGRFRPHKTHQNGLSVDFFVPVRDARGRPAVVPTRPWTRFGYDLEFDAEGRLGGLRIDFDALAAHLLALAESGRGHGVGVELVIFDPKLQPLLFRTPKGRLLSGRMRFSTRPAWVRHDEHYHVDFRLLSPGAGRAASSADELRASAEPQLLERVHLEDLPGQIRQVVQRRHLGDAPPGLRGEASEALREKVEVRCGASPGLLAVPCRWY